MKGERWDKQVEKLAGQKSGLTRAEGVMLIHREHAGVVRMVKRLYRTGAEFGSESYGYNKALDDILTALATRKGGGG